MTTGTNQLRVRLNNLLAAISQNKIVTHKEFGSDEELKEIGLLTMRFTELEASLALYAELLLFRAELGGFHQAKPIVEKAFGEKLDLIRTLTTALGVLHRISPDSITDLVEKTRAVGEDRNSIIHGYLALPTNSSALVFRRKNRITPADLDSLRNITAEVLQTDHTFAQLFNGFYKKLPAVGAQQAHLTSLMVTALEAKAKHLSSAIQLRQSQLTLAASQRQAAIAARRTRTSRARLKRARLKLKEHEAILQSAIATEPEGPERQLAVAKLSEVRERLRSADVTLERNRRPAKRRK
jgi:hypothetical protein